MITLQPRWIGLASTSLFWSCSLLSPQYLHASTAAFEGDVVAVEPAPEKEKETHCSFTVKIDYFDYVSWGKFGRDSKTGETITRKVKKQGTVCVINGRLVNAATFAAAIREGTWGYFYEDTWLDLQTTPEFTWGEVVRAEPASGKCLVRIHRTHKEIHLAANPPVEQELMYTDDTLFRTEDKVSDADGALVAGNWVQVHPRRPQIISVWTEQSAFDPSELLRHEDGKRGYANDLSCAAVLKSCQVAAPRSVIDLPAELTVERSLPGKSEQVTLNCRKTSFVLDGKLCPAGVAFRPGRRAVLGHYRRETAPHKVLVRSHDDAVRGTIVEVSDGKLMISTADDEVKIAVETSAEFQLDGRPARIDEINRAGAEVVVYPRRGETVIAFPYQITN